VKLPAGLRFRRHRVYGRLVIRGVFVSAAKVRRITLSHGLLVIALRVPTAGLSVKVTPRAMREAAGLKRRVRHHRIRSVLLTVTVTDAAGTSTALHARIRRFR